MGVRVRIPLWALILKSTMNKKRRLASLIIWWCEGTKIRKDKRWKDSYNCPIEVTNTDPKLIKIFIDFLRQDLGIEAKKLKAQVQIHKGDNQAEIESFWSKVSNIPLSQFNKTIIRETGKKIGKTKGTFKVRVYSKSKFEEMKDLLEEELKEVITGE